MVLGALGASLLGIFLTGRDKVETRSRNCKSCLWKQNGILIPPHLLNNFEIQKYYENEPRFKGIYSRDNLPKIKDSYKI